MLIGKVIAAIGKLLVPQGYTLAPTPITACRGPKEYSPEEAILASIRRCNPRKTGAVKTLRRAEGAYQRGEGISKHITAIDKRTGGEVFTYRIGGLVKRKVDSI
jgi:hypothetical protein